MTPEPNTRKGDSEMEDLVEHWHNGEGDGQPLHEFLGMTWEQYADWVEHPPPEPKTRQSDGAV